MVQVVKGKCSHCGACSAHTLEDRSLVSRNVYLCSGCKKKTVVCRICRNMAKAESGWVDEICSDHWASEDLLAPGHLSCISEWAELWKADPSLVKRALWAISPY